MTAAARERAAAAVAREPSAVAREGALPPAPRRAGEPPRAEALLGALALAALVAVPLLDMAGRRVLGRGLPGAAGWAQHLTLWLTFVGGALATRLDRHLALSTLAFLPRAAIPAARAVGAVAAVIVSLLLALSAGTLVSAQRASTDTLAGGVPVWAAQLAMPAGFAAIAARFWWRAPGGWRGRLVVLAAVAACAAAFAAGLRGEALLWPGGIALAACVLLGAPLFVALGGLALLLFHGAGVPIAAVAAETYRLAASPTLPVIPLFALVGTLLGAGGASRRLVGLFRAAAGWMPGGTAVAAVGACAFLTALTGASGVTILAVGGLLLPVLLEERYRADASVGLLTAGGSIGLLFPPSLPVILYAVTAEVSLGELFLAGLVPGLLLVVAMAAWAMREGIRSGVPRTRLDGRAALRAAWAAKWDLGVPAVVVSAVASGFASLVEAAALAVAWVLLVEVVVHRTLSLRRDGLRVVVETGALFGALLLVLGVALGLTSFLVDAQVPALAVAWVRGSIESRWAFLLALNAFLLVVGMTMDVFSAIVVVVPLLLPVGRAFGVHPLHLGIVFLANLELGYLTPPVGLNLFLASMRFGRPVLAVARAALPAMLLMAGWVLLVTYVPAATLGLGALLGR